MKWYSPMLLSGLSQHSLVKWWFLVQILPTAYSHSCYWRSTVLFFFPGHDIVWAHSSCPALSYLYLTGIWLRRDLTDCIQMWLKNYSHPKISFFHILPSHFATPQKKEAWGHSQPSPPHTPVIPPKPILPRQTIHKDIYSLCQYVDT